MLAGRGGGACVLLQLLHEAFQRCHACEIGFVIRQHYHKVKQEVKFEREDYLGHSNPGKTIKPHRFLGQFILPLSIHILVDLPLSISMVSSIQIQTSLLKVFLLVCLANWSINCPFIIPKKPLNMGSTQGNVEGLGHQALLDKIDKLRELNVGTMVPLPQLVVVGDQSSGKSSVLESLTGFSFPRAAGLCTRYATQITCRREPRRSVSITIMPRPNANDVLKQRLKRFRRYVDVDAIDGQDLASIFEEASLAMGIRSGAGVSDDEEEDEDYDLITFSEDILKIEVSGPDQPALTVIDVPGIFRTATPGLTTESDISLVTSMVKNYMKDSRTIILAVIPCNVDIATQEILKLAKDADPPGFRTMGVLTKPDLAPERAMQQNILDLIQGKRQDLKLGYCVVKNRGADDKDSTLKMRNDAERAYFREEPWSAIASSNRVGISALKVRLRDLLMDISKREFPKVKAGKLHLLPVLSPDV